MTKNKRFTLEETDWSYRIRDNGAIMKIPKIVDLLNEQDETIQHVTKTLQSFSKRDLVDIERVFLNNLCKELGIKLE